VEEDLLQEKLQLVLQAGAIAKLVLQNKLGKKFKVIGAVTQLGILGCDTNQWNDKVITKNPFFCPDKSMIKLWEKYLLRCKKIWIFLWSCN
jgi:chorismate synthase